MALGAEPISNCPTPAAESRPLQSQITLGAIHFFQGRIQGMSADVWPWV